MRILIILLVQLWAFYAHAQFTEDFNQSNSFPDDSWQGDRDRFIISTEGELRSNSSDASESVIFRKSSVIRNAHWECRVRMDYPTSSGNYSCVYLLADTIDLQNGFRAYFVKVGGAEDEVSLYLQLADKTIEIIDGTDKRTDGKKNDMRIRVRVDKEGNFTLYDRFESDSIWYQEGNVKDVSITSGHFFGLGYKNSASTGKLYFFDDIVVAGEEFMADEFSKMKNQEEILGLSTEYFSPDGDGYLDDCKLLIFPDVAGYRLRCRIFNSSGNAIRNLADCLDPGQKFALSWDGNDDLGRPSGPGIYVFYVQLFNELTGKVMNKKLPVALVRS